MKFWEYIQEALIFEWNIGFRPTLKIFVERF